MTSPRPSQSKLDKARRNQFAVLVERYGGQKSLSDALISAGINGIPSWVSLVINNRKNLGEDKAREIERALKLPYGWFDEEVTSRVRETASIYSAWPFEIDRGRYDRLTDKQKQRINGALQLMISEYELEAKSSVSTSAGERRSLQRK